MPQMTSSSESSSLYFHSVFNTALEAYENKTKNKLLTHPLATQLQSRNSPAAVLSMLQELIQRFDQRYRGDERLTSWLNPTVNVLFSFSALISEGVGLVSLNYLASCNRYSDCYLIDILTFESHICWHWNSSIGKSHIRFLNTSHCDTVSVRPLRTSIRAMIASLIFLNA
jgi:hypothetical protein